MESFNIREMVDDNQQVTKWLNMVIVKVFQNFSNILDQNGQKATKNPAL